MTFRKTNKKTTNATAEAEKVALPNECSQYTGGARI